MMILRVTILISGIALVAGCAEPPQPRSVQEFVDNPIVLEAALVRCSRNRSETRYDAECVNAREANKIIAASEEAERRAEFEAQSERKRQALRRAQEAAAEARRRAAEAAKRREEAAYLAQFGQLPPDDSQQTESDEDYSEPLFAPASDASNAPVAEQEPEPARNLDEIREELKRRNEE
jgi:hypothetical protein